MIRSVLSTALLVLLGSPALAQPAPGFHPRVQVTAPTRIDWTFVLASQSLAAPPPAWLGDYRSTDQSFELYVPAKPDPKQHYPALLFISPGDQPQGWKHLEGLCKERGLAYIGVRGAGNSVDPRRRVRIVLDVLDEVRRQLPIDPDRTYLAGFSGGGRIACAIGFALPEYCGGLLPICAGGSLREESWLRQRVIDRLSVACLSGERDFNRGEVERLRGPFLERVGVRARVWVEPGLGHGIPGKRTLSEALAWLEEDLPRRRQLGARFPATHVEVGESPTREQQAALLLAEGKKRLEEPATLYSGLMLLKGCMERWPELAPGKQARQLLLEYDGRQERPWEKEDLEEQRRFLLAQARSLDAYASGELPPQYIKMRPEMVEAALELWQQVAQDRAGSPLAEEAARRRKALEKLLQDK